MQFKAESLKTRSCDVKGQEKMDVPAQEKEIHASFTFFALFGPPVARMTLTYLGEGKSPLLSLLH